MDELEELKRKRIRAEKLMATTSPQGITYVTLSDSVDVHDGTCTCTLGTCINMCCVSVAVTDTSPPTNLTTDHIMNDSKDELVDSGLQELQSRMK